MHAPCRLSSLYYHRIRNALNPAAFRLICDIVDPGFNICVLLFMVIVTNSVAGLVAELVVQGAACFQCFDLCLLFLGAAAPLPATGRGGRRDERERWEREKKVWTAASFQIVVDSAPSRCVKGENLLDSARRAVEAVSVSLTFLGQLMSPQLCGLILCVSHSRICRF